MVSNTKKTVTELDNHIKRVEKQLKLLKKERRNSKQKYCQRLIEFLIRDGSGFNRSQFKIIDYNDQFTNNCITVLFTKKECPNGVALDYPEALIKYKLTIRIIKSVDNGLIFAYHFND